MLFKGKRREEREKIEMNIITGKRIIMITRIKRKLVEKDLSVIFDSKQNFTEHISTKETKVN